jgi:hypothetical protein
MCMLCIMQRFTQLVHGIDILCYSFSSCDNQGIIQLENQAAIVANEYILGHNFGSGELWMFD